LFQDFTLPLKTKKHEMKVFAVYRRSEEEEKQMIMIPMGYNGRSHLTQADRV
jgi:hypothetical protein